MVTGYDLHIVFAGLHDLSLREMVIGRMVDDMPALIVIAGCFIDAIGRTSLLGCHRSEQRIGHNKV